MADLFRKEAVDHATRRLSGTVILAAPLSLQLLSLVAIVFVAAAFAFAATATYTETEPVSGWLAPEGGLIRVAARQGGVVETVKVREGEAVPAGAAIATLRLSTDVASGDAGRAVVQGLSAEAEADRAQARAARLKLDQQRAEMVARKAALARELAETRAQIELLDKKRLLADADVARRQSLVFKGFATEANTDQVRSTALSAAQAVSAAREAALGLQRQMQDLDHEIVGVTSDAALQAAQAAQTRASLAQRQATAEAESDIVATAPIGGRVVAIAVDRGQTVPAGGAVAVLTPAGAALIAELYVPSRAAGFIRPGQTVRIHYQAFPYQTFGTARGVVKSVSRTVLAPNEVSISGLQFKEPVFRVRAALDRQSVSAYGNAVPLQPGMLLDAEVVTRKRTLLQWLLDPLYAMGRRS